MRSVCFALSLPALAVAGSARAAPAANPALPALSAEERTLREVYLPITGPSVLDFFRQQTRTEADPKRIEMLIAQLGDAKPAARREQRNHRQTAPVSPRQDPSQVHRRRLRPKETIGHNDSCQEKHQGLNAATEMAVPQ